MPRAVFTARLLGQDAVPRVGLKQNFNDGGLGRMIDFSDKVVGLFGRDPHGFNVQRGTVDDGAGGARSLDGHIEHGV